MTARKHPVFALQLGHPKIADGPFPPAESVAGALVELFRPEEESVYLFWHGIPVRLRYRQDLTRCFDEVLAMAWLLQRDERGATEVRLETQTLSVRWEIRWDSDDCDIRADFAERFDFYAPYAGALNRLPDIRMSKGAFLREWNTLLRQLVVSIETGRVEIRDGVERRKWELLQRVERTIGGYGVLYTRPA